MKKFFIIAGALIALAVPTVASAYTVNSDGSIYVSKGEVQTALHMNNNQFDNGTFTFTGPVSVTSSQTMTYKCGDNTTFVDNLTQTNTGTSGTMNPVPVLSSNGKQITGWNVSAAGIGGTITPGAWVHSNPTAQFDWTMCRINSGDFRYGSPTSTPMQYSFSATGGLNVNNVALAPTPTV